MARSPAERLALLGRRAAEEVLGHLDDAALEALAADWRFWARPEQLEPPGHWRIWVICAGRGWGKTRTGAEWVHDRVRRGYGRIHLVARTAADYRDVMVEGESGLLATAPRGERVVFRPALRRVEWESTGAVALCFSAEEPDQLRGPQCDTAWADEPSTWQMLRDDSGSTAWDNLELGLRLGPDPRMVATMTPKPVPMVRDLLARHGRDVHLTTGSLLENVANLAPGFVHHILDRYGGTRLGAQEIEGRLLEAADGALFSRASIERDRLAAPLGRDAYDAVAVGVDPAVGGGETGIVVVARTREALPTATGGHRRQLHVLVDATVSGPPDLWARRVAALARERRAVVVAEANQGGAMVRAVIRHADPSVAVVTVRAVESKRARAEPVSLLAEQGRLRLVGHLPDLESQMLAWEPGADSPDRLDALVWAATWLMGAMGLGGRITTGAGWRIPVRRAAVA